MNDRAAAVFLHGDAASEAAIRKAERVARRLKHRLEDLAVLVRFLLCTESGFITGDHVLADGGMTRRMIHVQF
jgi:hypothetical protein